jgi:prolyl-tRNA synthetase
MRQTHLFTKTRKEAPKDEVSKNAELLVRAGFVHKEMAGVYSLLPLGLRVMRKIADIIREELDSVGCQEVEMTTLQDPELWKKTNRWTDNIDNWFTTKLSNGTELGLALTHEEAIANILKNYVSSYKDLPLYVYQIQTKFRNELRAKSGMMRGREFLMKDLYSFHTTEEDRVAFYELMKGVYTKIYERVGLGDVTFLTFASGGIFSQFSHEFQTVSSAGEDTIYIHKESGIAVNLEVMNGEVLDMLGLKREELVEEKAIEVGNIFPLGTKFSSGVGLSFTDENGENKAPVMGSYGIGLGRIMGTVTEVYADERGMVWPESIAPFHVHLVSLCKEEADIIISDEAYLRLNEAGIDTLYDDRSDMRPGEKFADADLIGIPIRLVISPKTIANNTLEIKSRTDENAIFMSLEEFIFSQTEKLC